MATHTVALVRMNRWVILAGYALLTACTQLLWLAYAPITTQTHHAMNVSSAAVGDLAIIFPVMYVILALPAGRWLDARFGQALGIGLPRPVCGRKSVAEIALREAALRAVASHPLR